nr:hypothetical protein CFP56_00247 [Quercus suber]
MEEVQRLCDYHVPDLPQHPYQRHPSITVEADYHVLSHSPLHSTEHCASHVKKHFDYPGLEETGQDCHVQTTNKACSQKSRTTALNDSQHRIHASSEEYRARGFLRVSIQSLWP